MNDEARNRKLVELLEELRDQIESMPQRDAVDEDQTTLDRLGERKGTERESENIDSSISRLEEASDSEKDAVETLRDRVHRIEEKDMIHFEGEKASKGGRHFNRDDEEVKALEVKLKEKFKSM